MSRHSDESGEIHSRDPTDTHIATTTVNAIESHAVNMDMETHTRNSAHSTHAPHTLEERSEPISRSTNPTFHIEPQEIDALHDANATNYRTMVSPASSHISVPPLLRRRSSRLVLSDAPDWTTLPTVPSVDLHPEDANSEWRKKGLEILESHKMHLIIMALVLIDLAVVVAEIFIELISYQECIDHEAKFEGDKFEVREAFHVTEEALRWTSLAILSLFVAEIIAKGVVFRLRYFLVPFHMFDALIILLSFFSTIFLHGIQETIVTFFIFLRLWRVFRIIDGVAVALEDEHDMEKERLEAKVKRLEAELKHARSNGTAQYTEIRKPSAEEFEGKSKARAT